MRLAWIVLAVGCAAAPPHAAFSDGKQASGPGCHTAADCVLVPRSCCGHCGRAIPGDARAVPASRADRAQPARCRGGGCPRCYAPSDDAGIVAYCGAGACRVLDLTRSPMTRCTADTDCTLRARSCCECDAQEWVALRSDQTGAYARRVCDPTGVCPACEPAAPAGHAICDAGHCAVRGGDALGLGLDE